jgi:hypothetical protein
MSDGPQPSGVPEGSVAVGNRIRLPRGAEPPYTVYINGVEQQEGTDYRVAEGEIVFERQIVKEAKVGIGRWLAMVIGLFGTYRRNETVDIEFQRRGRIELASDLPVREEERPAIDPHEGRSHQRRG